MTAARPAPRASERYQSAMAYVQALAADVAGSEGLLTPFIVCDEVANWQTTANARRIVRVGNQFGVGRVTRAP